MDLCASVWLCNWSLGFHCAFSGCLTELRKQLQYHRELVCFGLVTKDAHVEGCVFGAFAMLYLRRNN